MLKLYEFRWAHWSVRKNETREKIRCLVQWYYGWGPVDWVTDHLTRVGRRGNPWWPQGGIGGPLSCTSPGPAAPVWQAVVLEQIAKRIQRAAPLSDCTSAEQALERSGGLPTTLMGILGTDSNNHFPIFNISNGCISNSDHYD